MKGWVETPWDRRALGFDTYEIKTVNEETFRSIEKLSGHFTVRINPLESKKLLHDFGFYYGDTLIEPFCLRHSFKPLIRDDVSVRANLNPEQAAEMCRHGFKYDRFHRDFHIPDVDADRRYALWVQDIAKDGKLYGLMLEGTLAGFFACKENAILLHAILKDFQGKGLAKYFWSAACQVLFKEGFEELKSSISAANMAVLNLYRSIGFSFRNPVDIYHKFNP